MGAPKINVKTTPAELWVLQRVSRRVTKSERKNKTKNMQEVKLSKY
jgi:hypothetical protein